MSVKNQYSRTSYVVDPMTMPVTISTAEGRRQICDRAGNPAVFAKLGFPYATFLGMSYEPKSLLITQDEVTVTLRRYYDFKPTLMMELRFRRTSDEQFVLIGHLSRLEHLPKEGIYSQDREDMNWHLDFLNWLVRNGDIENFRRHMLISLNGRAEFKEMLFVIDGEQRNECKMSEFLRAAGSRKDIGDAVRELSDRRRRRLQSRDELEIGQVEPFSRCMLRSERDGCSLVVELEPTKNVRLTERLTYAVRRDRKGIGMSCAAYEAESNSGIDTADRGGLANAMARRRWAQGPVLWRLDALSGEKAKEFLARHLPATPAYSEEGPPLPRPLA